MSFSYFLIVNIGLTVFAFALQGMVCVQMLSELEEVVWYKLNPERSSVIKQIWWDRLQVIFLFLKQLLIIVYVFMYDYIGKHCFSVWLCLLVTRLVACRH